ncbi:MAG: alpha/beta hydrolase [Promethearchaeati archaeon SRVP18_Atabeyarchaeia-1]
MPFAAASRLKTYVYEEGAGKPSFVLIHGAAYNHRLWIRQWPALSSMGRVVALDLPGHGESAKFPAGQAISIKAYADHTHGVLSTLKCQSNVVIGHSMGGAVAMRYALDHPRNVRALVLVGTGAKLGVSPTILEGLSADFEQAVRASIGGWAFAKTTDERLVEEGIKEMLKCDKSVALADFKACDEFDIRDSVSEIRAPSLIVVGDEDRLTPVKWSQFLNINLTGSQMKIIKSAGHMVMLEKADQVNDALKSFVGQLAEYG